jgi:hypothetical protein
MATQLERLCKKHGIQITARLVAANPNMQAPMPGATHWAVTLTHGSSEAVDAYFSQGSAICAEPTAADVLSCLILDARCGEMSFEEFCGDFGYDEDSRTAYRTWETCAAVTLRIQRFLGDDREAFEAAEH